MMRPCINFAERIGRKVVREQGPYGRMTIRHPHLPQNIFPARRLEAVTEAAFTPMLNVISNYFPDKHYELRPEDSL